MLFRRSNATEKSLCQILDFSLHCAAVRNDNLQEVIVTKNPAQIERDFFIVIIENITSLHSQLWFHVLP